MDDRLGHRTNPPGISPALSRVVPYRRPLSTHTGIRSGLRMTTYNQVAAVQGSGQNEIPARPVHQQIPPPPLAPYVRPEKRFFAPQSEDYRGQDPRDTNNPWSRAHPSIPPPQRPAPPHIPPPPLYSSFRPPSPPSSRGKEPLPPINPDWAGQAYFATRRAEDMSRSHSQSSQLSTFSAPSGQPSRTASTGSGNEEEEPFEWAHAASEPAPEAGQILQRPKRSRVLMTNIQQQALSVLWKRVSETTAGIYVSQANEGQTKFPSTQEREEIANEIGLTPRQVQVWFQVSRDTCSCHTGTDLTRAQNRRQNFRKVISSQAVPADADPADYEDLQQSPRSRRMSIDQSSDERVSQCAASSSSTGMSSRSMPSGVFGGPIPPSASGMMGESTLPMLYLAEVVTGLQSRDYSGPSTSSSRPTFNQSPSSPIKRKLPESSVPRAQRISWQSSSSAGPRSGFVYPPSSSSSSGVISPSYGITPLTLSPPPTAESSRPSRPIAPSPRRIASLGGIRDLPRPNSPEILRPSHLPPSLAALALTRPVDPAARETTSSTLPSLDLSSSVNPSRPTMMQRKQSGTSSTGSLPTFRDLFGNRRQEPKH